WLSDHERDELLARIRRFGDERNLQDYGPTVFEGNAPADVRENALLRALLQTKAVAPPAQPRIWLGTPNSIKGPTEVVFQKRTGSNLLIVGQREEATAAIISAGVIALAAQHPNGAARAVICDSAATGSPGRALLERVARAAPAEIVLARDGDVTAILDELAKDLQKRIDAGRSDSPAVFLFIHGLERFKKLRADDEFSLPEAASQTPAAQFRMLVNEGPSYGVQVIATVDSYTNAVRFLGRKGLSDFEMRVLFQMSANDSSSLCDDPKASTLGLHRALLYNEQAGSLETFRPYALPSSEWLDEA